MGKNKTVYIAVGIIAVAAGIMVYDNFLKEGLKDPMVGQGILGNDVLGTIESLEVKNAGESMVVAKTLDGRWLQPNSFPANPQRVVTILDNFMKAKVIRSTKLSDKLEIGSGGEVSFLGKDGAVLGAFMLGKKRDGGGQFIQIQGKDEKAYLVDQTFFLDAKQTYWDMKQIANVKESDVKSVAFLPEKSLSRTAVEFSREKNEDPFKANDTGKKELDDYQVKQVAFTLSNFSVKEKLAREPEAFEKLFSKPSVAKLETFDGGSYEVKVAREKIKKDEYKYYLTMNLGITGTNSNLSAEATFLNELMEKWYFEIDKYQYDKVAKGLQDFYKEADPVDAKKGS